MTMNQKLLLLILVNGLLFELGFSQTSLDNKCRTIDGTFNNLSNPSWGATGSNLIRLGKAAYQDGIFQPFTGRISGRVISNEIFAQDEIDIKDPSNLSDFCWVFGQFIDHEFGLTPNNSERFDIAVPPGDIWFDPNDEGNRVIQMKRNLFDKNSGNSASNPRQHVNMVTSFIDGSAVYGSEMIRANWLRSFKNGKLKVSEGNLLPYNTLTGELDSPIDPLAPEMGNDTGEESKLFVAGDVRANENPLLASVHTLFVREHNRQCDLIKLKNPTWSDEEIYQYARKMVGGFIQQILFNEWLPSVGIHLPAYSGYKNNINPTVSNEFTGAGFRLGHTLLSSKIRRLNPDGTPFVWNHYSYMNYLWKHLTKTSINLRSNFKSIVKDLKRIVGSKYFTAISLLGAYPCGLLIDELKEIIYHEEIKDSLFLFCAGPLGNVLSHQLWKFNKNKCK
jgi:hypothetical protein